MKLKRVNIVFRKSRKGKRLLRWIKNKKWKGKKNETE